MELDVEIPDVPDSRTPEAVSEERETLQIVLEEVLGLPDVYREALYLSVVVTAEAGWGDLVQWFVKEGETEDEYYFMRDMCFTSR